MVGRDEFLKPDGAEQGFVIAIGSAHPYILQPWVFASKLADRGSTGQYFNSLLESTIRYLGIEVDDALEISEQIEI